VIRESADKPGHAWFRIPNELRPGEEPLAWMNSAPNAPALPARARAAMAKDLAEVVRLTRSIHVDVFSLSRKTEPFAGLIDTVQSHLSKAVDDIYAVKPPRAGAAMWELHLAMEKVLKAYLAQRGQAFKLTHDLRPLYKQALAAGLPAMEAGLVGSLPASKTSIRHRYGQGPPPSISAAYGAYRRALQVVRHCTSNLQHTLHMTNTAFLIKALWLEAEPKR